MAEDRTGVVARLDALEAAWKAASKAPWGIVGGTHDRDVIDDHGCHVAATGIIPDAAARPAPDDGEARCDPRTCSGHPVGDGVTSGGVVRHMSDPYRTAPSSPGSGDALHGRLAEALPATLLPVGAQRLSIAAALLPVVREAIADELDAAAKELKWAIVTDEIGNPMDVVRDLRARAAALRDGTRA